MAEPPVKLFSTMDRAAARPSMLADENSEIISQEKKASFFIFLGNSVVYE